MNAETQGGLLILTGGVIARMALSGTYLLYVKEGMRPWLLASAVVLLVLGALRVWSALRAGPGGPGPGRDGDAGEPHGHHDGDRAEPDGGHGDHDGEHHGAPRVAWLLVLPVLAVVLVAPNPLGSFAAARQSSTVIAEPVDPFPPLRPAADGTIALPVRDFVTRALFDDERSLAGKPVRLVGMVAPAGEGGTEDFRLVRFMLNCCAADARAAQVAVHGAPAALPANDAWVEVIGRWRPPADPDAAPGADGPVPLLDLQQVRSVAQPEQPYEG